VIASVGSAVNGVDLSGGPGAKLFTSAKQVEVVTSTRVDDPTVELVISCHKRVDVFDNGGDRVVRLSMKSSLLEGF
jgi:hypothetical protein